MSEPARELQGPVLPKCLVWREPLGTGYDPGAARASCCRRSPNHGREKGSPRGYCASCGGVPPVVGAVTGS